MAPAASSRPSRASRGPSGCTYTCLISVPRSASGGSEVIVASPAAVLTAPSARAAPPGTAFTARSAPGPPVSSRTWPGHPGDWRSRTCGYAPPPPRLRQRPGELPAGADAELDEHLAQVPLDRPRADGELGADSRVGQPVAGEPRRSAPLPRAWNELAFSLRFRGRQLRIKISHDEERYLVEKGDPLTVHIRGESHLLSPRTPSPSSSRRRDPDAERIHRASQLRDHFSSQVVPGRATSSSCSTWSMPTATTGPPVLIGLGRSGPVDPNVDPEHRMPRTTPRTGPEGSWLDGVRCPGRSVGVSRRRP